jgi:uncharacterized membrane protein
MASLTVWEFGEPFGADAALERVQGLQEQNLLTGSLVDVGISDKFIKDVRDQVTPGTSALFLLSSDAVVERVAAEFAGTGAVLISTNMSEEQESRLRAAFQQED